MSYLDELNEEINQKNTVDDILWELSEGNITLNELTKDQRYTMYKAYGDSWRGLVNELTNTNPINL